MRNLIFFKYLYMVVTLILIHLFVPMSYSQKSTRTNTPYEKRVLELRVERLKRAGETNLMQINFWVATGSDDFFIAGLLAKSLQTGDTRAMKAYKWFEIEFKNAQKLKTTVDFQREKDAREKRKKEETDKRLQIENEEKAKKLREQIEALEKTDYGAIKIAIKQAFEKWNQKGEFEKEADYDLRLRDTSQDEFFKICTEQIGFKIDAISRNIVKELPVYDSEKEFFTVTFKRINIDWQKDLVWQNKLEIPISKAADLKNNWNSFDCKTDIYDWCFVDNTLCPKFVTLEKGINEDVETDEDIEDTISTKIKDAIPANSKYQFPLLLNNQSEISYSFDELGIINPYLKSYVFKYSDVKKKKEDQERQTKQAEIEKQKLDSLECVKYEQKLDSVFIHYNQLLLKNPYNMASKVMIDYSKINRNDLNADNVLGSTWKQKFASCEEKIRYEFDQLNNGFSVELQQHNPSEFCRIYYSLYPTKKADAEKVYLECKCNYLNRTDFDLDFIKGHSFVCNCRDEEYKKSGELFSNKKEFDSYYDKGDAVFEEEVCMRTLRNLSSIFETIDFKGITNDGNQPYLRRIERYKNKSFYTKVIDYLILTNKGMNKEFSKNGQYFTSQIEFYNAYISDSYKDLLKEKKQ